MKRIRPLTSFSSRSLTLPERDLAVSIFGDAIDYDRVRINRRRWWPFQPRRVTMAPDGHLWFHPDAPHYRDCFGCADVTSQAHFIHEMTHVWQAAQRGKWWLPLMRHPFCRYDYTIIPGKPLHRYGIEQQAEIVKHAFLLRNGEAIRNDSSPELLEALLRFKRV
jgi:hypothetical protein